MDKGMHWIAAALRVGSMRVAISRDALHEVYQDLVEKTLDLCLEAIAAGDTSPSVLPHLHYQLHANRGNSQWC